MTGIIKASRKAAGDGQSSVAFNFEDLTDKANQYLDSVRRQAAKILTDAKQQAQEVEQRAREAGRQAALRQAEQSVEGKFNERLQTVMPALEQAVLALRESEQAWLNHWERQTVRLACAIAERVVRREIARTPEITLQLVREALELANGSARLRLHLNPQDHATLAGQVAALVACLQHLAPAEIVADPKISPGGCRVTTEFGSIDQQIETQLARIEEELT